jgi:hypothetical protein
LAGRVPLKIIYLLVRLVAAFAVLVFRKDLAKDAELLVLRHENAVLRRHARRIRYEPADRVWFTALAQLIPRRRWTAVFPVTPATLLAWHRRLASKKYDTSKRRKPVRAENLVRGSGQQGCSPGQSAVMITVHVPAVRVPPDYASRRGAAAPAGAGSGVITTRQGASIAVPPAPLITGYCPSAASTPVMVSGKEAASGRLTAIRDGPASTARHTPDASAIVAVAS